MNKAKAPAQLQPRQHCIKTSWELWLPNTRFLCQEQSTSCILLTCVDNAPTQTKCKCKNRRDCNTGMQMCVRTQQGTYQVPKQVSRSQDQRGRKPSGVFCARVSSDTQRESRKTLLLWETAQCALMRMHNCVCAATSRPAGKTTRSFNLLLLLTKRKHPRQHTWRFLSVT